MVNACCGQQCMFDRSCFAILPFLFILSLSLLSFNGFLPFVATKFPVSEVLCKIT